MASRLRVVLASLVFAGAIVAIAIHDGEGPELADLVDNRMHHEKLEAWTAIGWFLVLIGLTWPKRPTSVPVSHPYRPQTSDRQDVSR